MCLPYLAIKTDDNLMSSVWIRGSFQHKEDWQSSIYYNSPYFCFAIVPMKGARYYTSGENVTVTLDNRGVGAKFRKYTGPIDKVLRKIQDWIILADASR
jgi:hypothetical protein